MTCPDCGENLDEVPVGDVCPQCGGLRRDSQVIAVAAVATATIPTPTLEIGYSLAPGWTFQWRSIQRHLGRLREQYRGVGVLGNVDVEETVHALSSPSISLSIGCTRTAQ